MHGEILTDYTGRCGNCHKMMDENDKFCRYCGTPKGQGEFKPYENIVSVIYAPPMTTRHKCKKCKYEWVVNCLGRDKAQFCPKCGGKLKTKTE